MYREASSSRTWNVPAKMERPHLDSLSLYVRALQHAKVIDDNLQLSETLPKDVHEAYQQWARSIDPYIQGQSQEDTHKQKPNIRIIELTRVEMAGRNTEYEDVRRRRLEQFEIDTVLRSGLRRQLLDPGRAIHSHPNTTPATPGLPSNLFDFEVIDLTNANDPPWSEHEGTDAESYVPSSSPPGTDATDDSFAVADVTVMSKFEKKVDRMPSSSGP